MMFRDVAGLCWCAGVVTGCGREAAVVSPSSLATRLPPAAPAARPRPAASAARRLSQPGAFSCSSIRASRRLKAGDILG